MAYDDERGPDGPLVFQQSWILPDGVSAKDVAGRDRLPDAARLLLGLASLAVLAARQVLDVSSRHNGAAANEQALAAARSGDAMWRAAHAAVGLGIESQRRALAAVATVSAPVVTVASAVLATATARGPLAAGARALGRLSEQGLVEQRRSQEVALASAQEVVRAVITAVLAEVDIDSIVDRVDIDSIVTRLDMDSVVARLDIDSIVGRVDIDAIAARLDIDSVVARLDMDSIVARLDMDSIAARLDVNAVVQRVDLARVTEQVLDEVDVAHIVRESSGAIAAETVDAVRINGMLADGFLSRVVDRVLQRKAGRDTEPSTVSSTGSVDRP